MTFEERCEAFSKSGEKLKVLITKDIICYESVGWIEVRPEAIVKFVRK